MKLLIGVKSCAYDRDRGAHALVREIWGKDISSSTLLFFTGKPGSRAHHVGVPESDEIFVNAPDDYKSLPFKTREICRYALNQNYDYSFLCDTGSFLVPHHLEAYDFDRFDYVGYWGLKQEPFPYTAENKARGCWPIFIEKCFPWASGGGYILSRKAMEVIVNSDPFLIWAEDLYVGQALAAEGIFLEDRARAGYKGFIVDWIHNENNTRDLAVRRKWMLQKQEQVRINCETLGCDSLKRFQSRDPEEQAARFGIPKVVDVNVTPWDRSSPSWKKRNK